MALIAGPGEKALSLEYVQVARSGKAGVCTKDSGDPEWLPDGRMREGKGMQPVNPQENGTPPPIGTTSRVVTTRGADIEGPYIRFDIRSAEVVLETTLRGHTLHVDWIEGLKSIFNLDEVQTAAGGPDSITVIRGYVTDQMAVNVRRTGYIQRLANLVGKRLGGQWMAQLETSGSKTFLVLVRDAGGQMGVRQ